MKRVPNIREISSFFLFGYNILSVNLSWSLSESYNCLIRSLTCLELCLYGHEDFSNAK